MGRFLGGRIGKFIEKQNSGWADDGVHTISDQFYQKSINGWKEGVNASGGDGVITTDDYTYHVYKNDGTFTLNSINPQVIDVLLVGGGGCGGNNEGGGGGGGGAVKFLSQHPISPGPHSITIGGPGPANNTSANNQSSTRHGGNSVAFGWTAGGGAPGSQSHALNDSGTNALNPGAPNYVRGCGGGGTGRNGSSGGSGLTSGGDAVSASSPSTIDAGGGGGGAGGSGENSPGTSHGGDGGPGLGVPAFPAEDLGPAFDTAWTNTVGPSGYYGGGGGGGTELNTVTNGYGAAGVGGGGRGRHSSGAWPAAERDGMDYTGGGGGGFGQANDWSRGGKGLVIIRYS